MANRRRKAVAERAGSHLNPRTTHPVLGSARRGRSTHGVLDTSISLYQCGGEMENFLYRKEGLLSLDRAVWETVEKQAAYIEIVDHDTNSVYVITVAEAKAHGRYYDAGIGPRYGVPGHHWRRFSAEWQELPSPFRPKGVPA